ncbi:MAG: SCO family protein [Chitinophagaceae bacterium]
MMNKKIAVFLSFFIVLLVVGFFVYLHSWGYMKKPDLPVLGNPGHRIGSFSLVNQAGKTITEKNMDGHVCVVEYFFTTCTGICPKMNKNMRIVYARFKNTPNFLILSHTADPTTDSVPVLERYSEQFGANPNVWMFLTGPKKELNELAIHDYLLGAADSVGVTSDFVHTQWWALIDKNRQIRGFYDGLNKDQIHKMLGDIKTLLQEP